MSLAIIIMLPIAVAFGLLYWATQLDEESMALLKLMFQLAFLPLMFLSVHFAVIDASIVYSSNTELVALLADFTYYLGWFMFLVGGFIIYALFVKIKDLIMQKRAQRMEEKYG